VNPSLEHCPNGRELSATSIARRAFPSNWPIASNFIDGPVRLAPERLALVRLLLRFSAATTQTEFDFRTNRKGYAFGAHA
jgi:hypothetical protein